MSTQPYRINHQIQAKEVRLLREDGTQVGVVVLAEALSQAKTEGVDLVEIAPNAVPPVVKLIDYKKFLYQIAKRERESKASQKKVELKEVRLTPFMAQNDFDNKVGRAKEWLEEGNKVRISIKFVGRQLSHKEFGTQVMTRAMQVLGEGASFDQEPKWVGKQFMATVSPVKKSK